MIPGFLLTWLTFPGVIVHEFAHQLFCWMTGTRVIKVCYFRFGNPSGFVLHEAPSNFWKHLLIGFGPLVVNSVLGLVLGLIIHSYPYSMAFDNRVHYFLLWLAISIAMHSFPSTGDASSLWKATWSKGTSILGKIVGLPLVLLVYLGALGSVFWLDLIYGYAVVYLAPKYLMDGRFK